MKDVWDRLENEFGRADEVGMTLLDGFSKLTLSHKSEHDNFIQLFDKFEETLHDLKEIDRVQLMKEQRSMRDVTEKMSRGIKDRFYEYSIERESDDKWEVLQAFMKKQVEISRRWVRNSASSTTDKGSDVKCHKCQKTGHVKSNCPDTKKNIANSVSVKDKQKEFGPCPACKGGHAYKDKKSGQERASCRLYSCEKFRNLPGVEDRVKMVLDCEGCVKCTS